MTAIRLSFCIPTFNTGKYLGAALESIAAQANEDIEIVVADGASTDDTPEVMRAWAARLAGAGSPRLVYLRGDKNLGVDRDMARAVAGAHGEHCWLLSADDALAPGALAKMRAELAHGDVALCNRMLCDIALRPQRPQRWLAGVETRSFDLSQRGDLLAYLRASRSIGALFSFCSTIAFRRDAWASAPVDDSAVGSNFAHVHRLFASLLQSSRSEGAPGGAPGGALRSRLRYVSDPLVLCRGDNDSFAVNGQLRRFLIDIDGYAMIAKALFPGAHDDEARAAFMAVMRHEHPWWRLAGPRGGADAAAWRPVREKLATFGYPRPALAFAEALGERPLLLSSMRRLRRTAKKLRALTGPGG